MRSRTSREISWLIDTCDGDPGTVGGLVPAGFDAVVRVSAPPDDVGDWIAAYRDLFGLVASIGVDHTERPRDAWFAIERANDFGQGASPWMMSTGAARSDDEPWLVRPQRAYRLTTGPIWAVTRLIGPSTSWRHPDLFWPDDHAWFVATDVDFWSLYVAGPDRFVSRIEALVPTGVERVDAATPLVMEE